MGCETVAHVDYYEQDLQSRGLEKTLEAYRAKKWEVPHERLLATSDFGRECIEHFEFPELAEVEGEFSAALEEIADPELRNRLDTAAGRLTFAYQALGFCGGWYGRNRPLI